MKKRDSGIGCVGWIFMSIVEFFAYILQAGEFYSIVMMIIIAGFLGLFFVVYGKLIVLIGSVIYMVLLIVFQPAILSYMVKRVIDISAKNEIIVHEGLLTNPYYGKIKISILFGILVTLLLCLPLIYIFIKS